jgi:hypothetical protein
MCFLVDQFAVEQFVFFHGTSEAYEHPREVEFLCGKIAAGKRRAGSFMSAAPLDRFQLNAA